MSPLFPIPTTKESLRKYTETPFLVTTLILKRKVNVTVIIFNIASPVYVVSMMKFANNQKHCKYA